MRLGVARQRAGRRARQRGRVPEGDGRARGRSRGGPLPGALGLGIASRPRALGRDLARRAAGGGRPGHASGRAARIAWPGAPATRSRGGERMSARHRRTLRSARSTGSSPTSRASTWWCSPACGARSRSTRRTSRGRTCSSASSRRTATGTAWRATLLWIAQAHYVALFAPRAWSGKPIDIDFGNQDLREALRQIARNGWSRAAVRPGGRRPRDLPAREGALGPGLRDRAAHERPAAAARPAATLVVEPRAKS